MTREDLTAATPRSRASRASAAPVAGGSLVGTALDPAGAALPGVSVEARPEVGGKAASVATAAVGTYGIDGLAAGRWEVSSQLLKFASSVSHEVVVRPGRDIKHPSAPRTLRMGFLASF